MIIAARSSFIEHVNIPYVTDGLVAWWDGIWNAGLGRHDANATVWRDLIGGHIASESTVIPAGESPMAVGENCMDTSAWFEYYMTNTSTPMTIELCSECLAVDETTNNSRPCYVTFGRRSGGIQGNVLKKNCPHAGRYNGKFGVISYTAMPIPLKGVQCRTWTDHSTCGSVYLDGVRKSGPFKFWDSGNSDEQLGEIPLYFGNHSNTTTGTRIRVFSVRVYTRVLTDAEIAANYAVDRERFGLP